MYSFSSRWTAPSHYDGIQRIYRCVCCSWMYVVTVHSSLCLFTLSDTDTVSAVNYTGSTGYGQPHVEKLRGYAGELDVEDCMAAARHLVTLGISEDAPGKQFILGGSHGGFIGAHCKPDTHVKWK
jgi:hypothetical protein